MSLSQTCCHVKPGKAKIPGISSRADPLLCHRREHSQLKTLLLFLLCCSKDFLWKKKQKAIHLALFFHSSVASSPGCRQPLPATLLPQHLHLSAVKGVHSDLPPASGFGSECCLSLMKTSLCVCVSEQDLHQVLGLES